MSNGFDLSKKKKKKKKYLGRPCTLASVFGVQPNIFFSWPNPDTQFNNLPDSGNFCLLNHMYILKIFLIGEENLCDSRMPIIAALVVTSA